MVVGRKGGNKEKEAKSEEEESPKKPKKGKKAAAAAAALTVMAEKPAEKPVVEKAADPIRSPLFNLDKPIPSSPTAGNMGNGVERWMCCYSDILAPLFQRD